MSEPQSIDKPAGEHSSVWRWWKALGEEDRAGRAELRRCGTVAEVAFTASYHRLLRRVGSSWNPRQVAALAAILAHVEEEPSDGRSLAKQMGSSGEEGREPTVSDTRFRHVLRNEDPDELMRELIRVVRKLGRKAAVDPLFYDLMHWSERTRLRWAGEYYEAASFDEKA